MKEEKKPIEGEEVSKTGMNFEQNDKNAGSETAGNLGDKDDDKDDDKDKPIYGGGGTTFPIEK